jgi:biotin carboxyl carrier protein
MILTATVGGRVTRLEVVERAGKPFVTVEGRGLGTAVLEDSGGPFVLLEVGDARVEVGLERVDGGYLVILPSGPIEVALTQGAQDPTLPSSTHHAPGPITAGMAGRMVRVLVVAGQEVAAGQAVAVVESMKMQNEVRAPRAGRVLTVAVAEGQAIDAGAPIVVLESP